MVKKLKKKPKIFLIEDDFPTIELYKDVFRLAGFDLEVFWWGGKMMERLKEIREGKKPKPDLILLDIVLSDINSLLILEEARKYPETKDLLIFALTNLSDPEVDQELIKQGIDKILVKTEYVPSKLVATIKETLKLK